ncbi:MAG: ADP-forming succinate--CoA ligase subunit beta [Candidatus Krumholzibacteriota bacterium]|nr:ADP-forming succinate--CoA ligase subunit beta [Candidatus Krumholzibacteriota bacterium]
MKIHEYQAKELFAEFGISVPQGEVAETPEEAFRAAGKIGKQVVVKAQIHAGGRGKGGGIKMASTPGEAEAEAGKIIGMNLVTHQTGPEGKLVRKALVEEAIEIESELYLGMVIDRETSRVVVIASEEGGMEIEVVASESPEKIVKEFIDPAVGLRPFQARKIAFGLNMPKELLRGTVKILLNLYRLFIETDASLAEINPLVITKDGRILAADAKVNFDNSALVKHPDIARLRDLNEEEPAEIEAAEHNLSYVKLSGKVGCMVNGAGLAMATMDIIQHYGAMPANFLDVGGAASAERVEKAFSILLSDSNVKVVLINIFGGIVRCDRVANGVIEAAKRLDVKVPVVVRLAGTNSDIAAEILQSSDLKFTVAENLADAARKAVEATGN